MDTKQILATVFSGAFTDAIVKAAKKAIAPKSKVRGEITVRIPFELTKGIDYDTACTVSLLSQPVLAKALILSGVTREAFKKALTIAAKEALEGGQQVGSRLSEADERVVKMVDEVQKEVIASLPRQPRNGVVKVKVLTPDGCPIVLQSTINS